MTDQDPPASNRLSRLHVRLTATERASLEREAAAAGVSLSDFVRGRVLGTRRSPLRSAMARAAEAPRYQAMHPVLFSELARIGNNLNQVARAFNSGQGIDRGRVVHLVAEVWQTMLRDEVTARYATMAETKVRARVATP